MRAPNFPGRLAHSHMEKNMKRKMMIGALALACAFSVVAMRYVIKRYYFSNGVLVCSGDEDAGFLDCTFYPN